MNTLILTDFYKVHHSKMYPKGMTKLYSNFTPRKSRIAGVDKVMFFGLQAFIKQYLIEAFNKHFFSIGLDELQKEYKFAIDVDDSHIVKLWGLGYLPIEIKALEEGSQCPIGTPCFTITNTHPDFGWLTNYLETLISCQMWQPITSATIAYEYKKLLSKYAVETTGSAEFVQWQGHDFSMRGMSSVESAVLSGMGHLTCFTGTDTIPAIYGIKKYYNAEGLIGASVPATEHSVMCMGEKESEIETFKRLLDTYPTGILSVVSDTWDLWKVCTEFLPALKEQILGREGKLVIRPDSGDPVDIICGADVTISDEDKKYYRVKDTFEREGDGDVDSLTIHCSGAKPVSVEERKGVIELLWDVFGGTVNEQGYKVLDPHIGAIYGDSITVERAKQICERLKDKGFASTNIVLGIGSYTYQYNTRDTFGFAMKATYGEVDGIGREIFKDPITDDGTKRSKKGLLCIIEEDGSNIVCYDQCTWEQERKGMLKTVFKDGKLLKETTIDEIRNRINNIKYA